MASAEPERILDERKVGNRVEYLVQRRGAAEAAWEPRIQLTSATSVLKEWQRVKEAKEAKDIRPEKRASKAPEAPSKKRSSPEKNSEQKQDLKRKHETPSSSTSLAKAIARNDDMNFAFTTSITAKPLSTPTKGESPAKSLPTNCVGILSILQPPSTTSAPKPTPPSPQKLPRSPKKGDYVFVPPPREKKTALTPSQREALKDHEAVPFYSALDNSRSADETNLALVQSMENSQEGVVDEPPKSVPKPAAPPAVLTWDDTLDRRNLLGSNSGLFVGADDYVQKLTILLDNAPLKEMSEQQQETIQAKLTSLLAKIDRQKASKR